MSLPTNNQQQSQSVLCASSLYTVTEVHKITFIIIIIIIIIIIKELIIVTYSKLN